MQSSLIAHSTVLVWPQIRVDVTYLSRYPETGRHVCDRNENGFISPSFKLLNRTFWSSRCVSNDDELRSRAVSCFRICLLPAQV